MMDYIIKLAQSNLISWLIILVAIVPPIYQVSWSITRNTEKVTNVVTDVTVEAKDGWIKVVEQVEIIQESISDLTASIKRIFKIKDDIGTSDEAIIDNSDIRNMDQSPIDNTVKDQICVDGSCPVPPTSKQYQIYQRQPLLQIFRR